jgi:hypothetical protein
MKVMSKIAGILAGMILITGCSIPAHRTHKGYSGPDLPPEQIATVRTRVSDPIFFVGIDETNFPKRAWGEVQLLPGRHIIKIGCNSNYCVKESFSPDGLKSTTIADHFIQGGFRHTTSSPKGERTVYTALWAITQKLGGYRVIDINVEAGHIYEIESQFIKNTDGNGYKWLTPVFDDHYAEQIKATIYDGMLKGGLKDNPREPYKRE